jgi:uncharacterized protein (UPF0335 family)
MLTRILFAPDAVLDAPAPAAAPSPSPAPKTPPASSAPPATPPPSGAPESPPSDDPFELPKKPAAAAPVTPKPGTAPASEPELDIEKAAPKQLRERVKQLNEEKKTNAEKISSLEAKIKEAESRGADTSALTTRLSALEKERDAALADLRAARQEASPEFKEKYDKPFNAAAERAKKQISELTVIVKPADADAGTPAETRAATWQDFAALYSLPVGKAIEAANAMFGPTSQFVLGLREKLLDLDTARQSALEEEKAQFKERTAKDIAEQAKHRENVSKLWNDTNKRLSESVLDYKSDSTDAEAAEARKHALSVFDSEIAATDREDFIKQKVLKDAHVRQKVGAYAVQKLVITRQKAEIEALKAQVAELKGTAPGSPQRPSGDAPAPEESDESWGASLVKTVK